MSFITFFSASSLKPIIKDEIQGDRPCLQNLAPQVAACLTSVVFFSVFVYDSKF